MNSNDGMIEIIQCCSRCGAPFQARAISWNGKPLFGSQNCPPCCAAENQEKQKAEMEARARSLCHSWFEICPSAYAETDQTRLPLGALNKVLHWQPNWNVQMERYRKLNPSAKRTRS